MTVKKEGAEKKDERREKKGNVSDVAVRADCGCTQKNKKAFLPPPEGGPDS